MIENQKSARNHEQGLGQCDLIAVRRRNFRFKKVYRFISKETHGSAGERWQAEQSDANS